MEWIVVTGHTVAEARDRGLDALAVAAEDADVEVLAEPVRSRWGRRHPARVRVRVRPVGPPPRVGDQRRDRRRSRRRSGGGQQRGQRKQGGGQSRRGRSSRRRSRSSGRGNAARPPGSAS